MFTVIFCNSAFQWFRQPAAALENCYAALRHGGRMGIQAPAGKRFCPNFRTAILAVRNDPRTAKTVAAFKPPGCSGIRRKNMLNYLKKRHFRSLFAGWKRSGRSILRPR